MERIGVTRQTRQTRHEFHLVLIHVELSGSVCLTWIVCLFKGKSPHELDFTTPSFPMENTKK